MPRADELRGAAKRRRRRTPPTSGHGPPPPPKPTLGTIPTLERAPGQAAAQQAAQRAQAARPKPQVPRIPIIRDPTPQQVLAAQRAVRATIHTHAKRTGKSARDAAEDLRTDPRAKGLVAASRYYNRQASVQQAERTVATQPREKASYPTANLAALIASEGTKAAHPASRDEVVRYGRALAARQSQRDRVSAGRHTKVGIGVGPLRAATIDITGLGNQLAKATTLGTGDLGPRTALRNILGDVKTLGEAPFIGGYELGAAAVEGLRKRPYLGVAALPGAAAAALSTERGQKLAKGVAEGYVEEAKHPLRYAGQHPLLAALDVSGAASVVGRTAGAVARSGVAGRRVAESASTVRPPIALVDEPGAPFVERAYSKDPIRKIFQVTADRARDPVRDSSGKVVTVEQRGKRVPLLKPVTRGVDEGAYLQRGEANFSASRVNAQERVARVKADRAGRVRGVRGGVKAGGLRKRPLRDLVAAATEGTITSGAHFAGDLKAYRDRVAGLVAEDRRSQAAGKGPRHYKLESDRKLAEENVRYYDAVLKSPKALARADRVVRVAEEHGRRLNEGEAQLIERKAGLEPEQARRRRLLPTAITHMGARHVSVEEHAALERAAVERGASRDEQIAVSGREPSKVIAHENAKAAHATAKRDWETKRKRVQRLQRRRSEIVGSQQTRRGQRGGAATGAERAKLQKIDADLRRARNEAAEARKQLSVKRAAERKNPLPERQAGVRKPTGEHLPTEEIENFLRSRGRDPETVAYLPHRADVLGRRAYHRRNAPGSRPDIGAQATTGEAYRKGHAVSSADVLREQGVRQATILNHAAGQDRLIGDYGIRHPAWSKAQRGEALTKAEQRIVDRGGYWEGREAAEVIRRVADRGEHLVALKAFPARLDDAAQAIVRDKYQGPGGMETLPQRLFNDRIIDPDTLASGRARNVVLAPGHIVDTLNKQLERSTGTDKFFQALNKPFRYAVLPQFRWLTGNFVEPYVIRLTASGSGLNVFGLGVDIAASRRGLARMERSGDPKVRAAAAEMRAHQAGGLFIGGGEKRGVRRTGDEYGGRIGAYGHIVRNLPVIKQMADLVTMPLHGFFGLNYVIERGAQHAAIGHQIRADVAAITGSWWKTVLLGRRALDEATRGLVNTPTQRRFARAQHVLLGKYEGYAPWLRRLVQGVAPFLPWALNAARFVYWTMPAHHSALTSLLIKTQQVVQKDWEQIHADVPPGSLKLAIPTSKGGWLDLARYTPYGLTGPAVEGEYENVIHQFAPQLSGTVAAIEGKDPFGRDLTARVTPENPRGQVRGAGRLGVAANTFLEAFVPYVSQIRRLREGGGTGLSTSNVISPKTKPGSDTGSALERTFSPFRPTYLRSRGAGTVVTGGGGKLTRQQKILVKAAERSAAGGLTDRQLEILERAAARAAGG